MGRKRKLYLGIKPIGRCMIKSRRLARHITSQYHIIPNEKNILESHNIHNHDTNITTTATSKSSSNSINNTVHSKSNVMCSISNDNRSRNITMNIDNNDDIHHSNKEISVSNILLSEEDKRKKRMEELDKQMDDIGGTNAYQQASIINTQHFKTSKWVYDVINNELHMISNETVVVATTTGAAGATASVMKNILRENRKEVNKKSGSIRMKGNNDYNNNDDDDADDDDGRIIVDNRLKVLEVGAINTQLQKYNQYLNIRAIDLHSQHSLIEECDFFSIIPKQCYDVVVCSMVLNCVNNPTKRGEMLGRLSMHIKPDKGVLFLILPSRCINSKHVGRMVHFIDLLHGFNLVEVLPRRITPKLIFFILNYKKINSNNDSCRIISERNNDDDDNNRYDADNYNNSDTDDHNWIKKVRDVWKDKKKNKIYKYFLQDLSHIPSNEFAISLPSDFIQ